MSTAQIVWLVLVVIFAVLEGMTVSLVSIWFSLGSLVALLVALVFPTAVVVQILVFFLVSLLAIFLIRPVASRLIENRRVPTNADANVGKVGQVLAEVQPGRFGRVKLEGLEWTAKSDYVLPVGTWCRVVAIEGVKLVVVPLPTEVPPEEAPITTPETE